MRHGTEQIAGMVRLVLAPLRKLRVVRPSLTMTEVSCNLLIESFSPPKPCHLDRRRRNFATEAEWRDPEDVSFCHAASRRSHDSSIHLHLTWKHDSSSAVGATHLCFRILCNLFPSAGGATRS